MAPAVAAAARVVYASVLFASLMLVEDYTQSVVGEGGGVVYGGHELMDLACASVLCYTVGYEFRCLLHV